MYSSPSTAAAEASRAGVDKAGEGSERWKVAIIGQCLLCLSLAPRRADERALGGREGNPLSSLGSSEGSCTAGQEGKEIAANEVLRAIRVRQLGQRHRSTGGHERRTTAAPL